MNVERDRSLMEQEDIYTRELIEPEAITPGEIIDIGRRRKWSLIFPTVVIMLIATVVAVVLPPVYQSTTTILIEEQDIPSEFVASTVSSYAEERLQAINQRIMSSTRLTEIITEFNLYTDKRAKMTVDEIVDMMRKDIKMAPISAEVRGRAGKGTIAFKLSYEGRNPATVQQVASKLASIYLEENLKVRERQAKETSDFLAAEMGKIEAQLTEADTQLAAFKEQNLNQLPDLIQVNVQGLNQVETQIQVSEEKMRNLNERRVYLQTQLAGISAELPQPLSENLGPVDDAVKLEQLRLELETLETRYSEKHPDVTRIKSRIAELEKKVAELPPEKPAPSRLKTPNPAYVTFNSELASIQAETESLKRIIGELQKKAEVYRHRIEMTPRIEGAYQAMLIQRKNLQAKYDDLMEKLMESRVSQGLEKAQMGERFTIIDPARRPGKPVKPNRLAILLIGLVMGTGAGVGLAALREFSDDAVRDPGKLERLTALPVLANIPEILTKEDIKRERVKTAAAAAGFLAMAAGAVTAFHFFFMNLEVFWARVVERFAL